ncbi:MAG: GTP-binding protein HflX [Arenicella sp.]|jgi:GTP-binding protein HflX
MSTPEKKSLRRALIVAVQLDTVSDVEFESSIAELGDLAKTLGLQVVGQFTQKRSSFDSTAYVGVGKREEIRQFLEGQQESLSQDGSLAATDEVECILVDHEISPSQALNLENEVDCEVMDRTVVILEIFHRNASSHASRVQVEIARLTYMAPRLREAAKRAGSSGRQRSGTGGRGTGQSRSQMDSQKVRDRIGELQKEIDAMEAGRDIQRLLRQNQSGLTQVALVGYTNAGKSTVMRALTGSDVLVANQLFATLDTKVRTLYPESVPRVLVSDTVGFIKNLPHGLVASFKSTLDEALNASLLLHVIDSSDPGFKMQLEVTDKVLAEIGADNVPSIRVFNKIDYLDNAVAQAERTAELQEKYPGCIVLSAVRKDDIAKLHQLIMDFFQQQLIESEIFLPWAEQGLRGEIFASCQVLEERADEAGAFFRFRASADVIARLRELSGTSSSSTEP